MQPKQNASWDLNLIWNKTYVKKKLHYICHSATDIQYDKASDFTSIYICLYGLYEPFYSFRKKSEPFSIPLFLWRICRCQFLFRIKWFHSDIYLSGKICQEWYIKENVLYLSAGSYLSIAYTHIAYLGIYEERPSAKCSLHNQSSIKYIFNPKFLPDRWNPL